MCGDPGKEGQGMETIGGGFFWQEMMLGRKLSTRGRTVTETDLINFVGLSWFNEQIFTDEEYIREKAHIKGRLIPGALVFIVAEGLVAPSMEGTGMAFLNMEMDIRKPSFVGDTLHVEIEVIEARAASTGNRGLVRTRNTVVNQKSDTVMTYTPLRLMRGDPATATGHGADAG